MAVLLEVLRQELSRLGWVEGKNIAFEYQFAVGERNGFSALSTVLVRLKLDLNVAAGEPAATRVR